MTGLRNADLSGGRGRRAPTVGDLADRDAAILDVLDDVGGSVNLDEIALQLRRRGAGTTALELIDALYRLENLGLVRPTHWQVAP